MPFKKEPQKFAAKINTLNLGTDGNELTLGGENVLPFYVFDAPIDNRPKIGVAISDLGLYMDAPAIKAYYSGAEKLVDMAKRAALMPGADFIVLSLDSAHPDKGDKSAEDCAAAVKAVADAVDFPLAVEGCKHIEKDVKVLEKVAEATLGKNILILSAQEENYKAVAAASVLAYSQNVAAESAVDINLAKQLNVLISQMGVKQSRMAMNLGSAAAGYGFEYIASTIERVKIAALAQSDAMLQMPVITPVWYEAWAVKESFASEDEYPEWGNAERRGVNMEISTAAACLAAGSNAVILCHPDSVKTVSGLITALVLGGK
jgi:acetyl-CoA decarbonylase/synthase complex subunit delta